VPLPLIDADELGRLLPMPAAIDALERAFAEPDLPQAPQRTSFEVTSGDLLLMPAAGDAGVGVKLVTLAPANPGRGLPYVQAAYVLFDAESLSPVAVLDGTALTNLRTAAVSGLATRHLARPDASRLVILGAGATANAHLDAILAVRPIRIVRVVSRSPGPAEALAARARDAGPEAVAEADVVCTCTTSERPVFDGALLAPGTHVNAIGAYRPDMRELDDEAVARARVVVETREAALAEAGDLVIPLRAGRIRADHVVADLGELVRGAVVRRGPEDVTVFKSVGIAPEDLVVARAALDARA
jgi:ornithine cyclodeaminase